MRVVDYKTGRAPSPGFEAKAMFQMRFYALVLWRIHGRVPRLLQLLYLGRGEVLRYEPDEADLLATERKVEALWAAIQRASETGDWRPNPSRLCDWCDHQALCPACGGTPPPLPLLPVPAVPTTEGRRRPPVAGDAGRRGLRAGGKPPRRPGRFPRVESTHADQIQAEPRAHRHAARCRRQRARRDQGLRRGRHPGRRPRRRRRRLRARAATPRSWARPGRASPR